MFLPAGNCSHDKKGLRARRDRFRQWGIRRLMGQIFLTSEKPDERSALLRHVIAERPAQHRIRRLERIEN